MENQETKIELQEYSYEFNVYIHNKAIKKSDYSNEGVISGRVLFHINNNIEYEKNGKIEFEPSPLDESFLNALGDNNEGGTTYDYLSLVVARDYIDAVIKKYEEMNVNELKNKNIIKEKKSKNK